MSFDRLTGELWLADVGQGAWEEVDLIVKGGNYGWVCYEGNVPGDPDAANCPPEEPVVFPRAVYAQDGTDCAVVGGFVYRGSQLAELDGWYIFGDNCSGRVRAYDTSGSEPPIILVDDGAPMFSMAELPNGEILVLAFDDSIYQLVRE
jgi:glucose/arabinose dehydrogenase